MFQAIALLPKMMIIKIKKKKIKTKKIIPMILIIKQILNIKKNIKKNNLKHSLFFAAILSKLDININDNASTFLNYSYDVFLLSFIALLCFINVLIYLFVYIIIQKKDYESRYPRLKKYVNYYKNINLLVAIIESVLCFISLLMLTSSSLYLILNFNS
jgi:hypothetical protein